MPVSFVQPVLHEESSDSGEDEAFQSVVYESVFATQPQPSTSVEQLQELNEDGDQQDGDEMDPDLLQAIAASLNETYVQHITHFMELLFTVIPLPFYVHQKGIQYCASLFFIRMSFLIP